MLLAGHTFLKLRLVFLLLPFLAAFACQSAEMDDSRGTPGDYVNTVGKTLPPDAAPPARQVLRYMSPEPRSLDPGIKPYDTEATIFPFEPLLKKDEAWNPEPAAAERWNASEDGRTWTFHLRPGARWSDGRPVTAYDFEYAYRRMVDPASANIYAFFYYDLKNARAISQGKNTDLTTLGVHAADSLTLVIETEKPAPYLPYIVSFGDAVPVPRWVVEKYGDRWTEPEYIVTNSGFKVEEWIHGSRMTLVPDPYYNGPHKPYLERVVHPFREAAAATILAYENNEVDMENVDINDLKRIRNDPVLRKELVRFHAMTTWYMFFRTQMPPFNDVRVREAFTRVIDRTSICETILHGAGVPAYTMIPPGFKEYREGAYREVQGFDPQRAKALMREAGYPDGRGFPRQTLWLRAPNPAQRMVAAAVQSMLKTHLGVEVDIQTADPSVYMDNLYRWNMNLGMLNFGADFLDPRNMLDMIWHSQPRGFARQDWTNPAFDRLVDRAASELNPERRAALYREATEIMVKDYPAAFLYHGVGLQLRKPWVRGYLENPDGTVGTLDWTKLYIAVSE